MKSDFKFAVQALKENEQIEVLTTGCSMRPLFREHKDVVIIKRADCPFKKGDVVLYPSKRGRRNILHRIIRFKGDTLIIRGDNNYFTEIVPKTQIVGVLKEFYRGGKYCNCEKSVAYKVYSWYIRNSYPLRYIWRKKLLPTLAKIKHKIFK